MKSGAEILAGIFFGVAALVHLARLSCPFEVIIGDYHVPLWTSGAVFVIAGLLSAWLFRVRPT